MAEVKKAAQASGGRGPSSQRSAGQSDDKRSMKKNRRPRKQEGPQDEFEQRIIDIARVTRVMAGGKRMRFRACVGVGNKKGTVGIGLAKGADVTMAVTKAVTQAKKNLIIVPIVNDTIPHEVFEKCGAAKILFKPAGKGRGVIAGGAVRAILELSGIRNISSKILGTNSKINNVKCTINALSHLAVTEKKDGKEKEPIKTDLVEGQNTAEKAAVS
jgi:small subunit ribosomal protein S5